MYIKIFQIDTKLDKTGVKFLNLDILLHKQEAVDSTIYRKVYSGYISCDTPEHVFFVFNNECPKGFTGHSLSVSDVIYICDSEKTEDGYYYCGSIGFEKIEFNENEAQPQLIEILLVKYMEKPKRITIEDTLENLQKLVGGNIEAYGPYKDDIRLICNEEGKINGLPLNRAIYDEETHEMIEIIAGDFFIVYAPQNSDSFTSLPEELMDKYYSLFLTPEIITVNPMTKQIFVRKR